MDRIKELEELILKKRDEINKIRNEIQDIKLSNFNTHMKGKFWKFGNDMDCPLEFYDCYVYWREAAFESQGNVYVNVTIFNSSISDYIDDTYMNYDMDRQIRFSNRVDYLDSIMRNAIEISKEEFIDGVVKNKLNYVLMILLIILRKNKNKKLTTAFTGCHEHKEK